MPEPLRQAALHAFAAIEILATGTEAPDDRLRSAVLRLHQVRASTLPEPLHRQYQQLIHALAAAMTGEDPATQLPVSRISYTLLTTQICAFYRRLLDQIAPQVDASPEG